MNLMEEIQEYAGVLSEMNDYSLEDATELRKEINILKAKRLKAAGDEKKAASIQKEIDELEEELKTAQG